MVFDAAAAGRPSLQVEEDRGLKVMYTGKGQTADALIEELVRRLAGKFEVSVATGDRAERDVAWFHGAAVWSAEALAREVEAARGPRSRRNRGTCGTGNARRAWRSACPRRYACSWTSCASNDSRLGC